MAHAYQKIGEFSGDDGLALEKRAEDEQAFILHTLISFWFEHGDGWREPAIDEIDRAAKLARAAFHKGAGDAEDGEPGCCRNIDDISSIMSDPKSGVRERVGKDVESSGVAVDIKK